MEEELLRQYVMGFFGYGSWSAKTWFIRYEEGGLGDNRRLRRRLHAWGYPNGQNRLPLADAHVFVPKVVSEVWFGPKGLHAATFPRFQATQRVRRGCIPGPPPPL
jgi:hypothetical protein